VLVCASVCKRWINPCVERALVGRRGVRDVQIAQNKREKKAEATK